MSISPNSDGIWRRPSDRADLTLDAGVFCWGLLLCLIQAGILLAATKRQAPQTAT